MPRRFYVPQSFADSEIHLTGKESHHLVHVLRVAVGQQAWIFDGAGEEALVEVRAILPDGATLAVLKRRAAQTETAAPLILGTAVPKGERFRWLVEKVTELGIHKFIPLRTSRSVVDPGDGKLEKMRQTVIEASKQCGRSRLMQIAEPIDWSGFVASEFANRTVLIAHPSGETWDRSLLQTERPTVLAIGPEGGFTDSEIELACAAGGKLLNLGPRILRIETASVALAALCGINCS